MNLKAFSVTKEACINWISTKPELVSIAFSGDAVEFADDGASYMSIEFEADIMGAVKYEHFGDYVMKIHCYMNPKYWHTEALEQSFILIAKTFKKAGMKSLMTTCPEDATHAIRASKKVGFIEIGKVKEATDWKGKVNDMIILQRQL